jgi:hypothetical protein
MNYTEKSTNLKIRQILRELLNDPKKEEEYFEALMQKPINKTSETN